MDRNKRRKKLTKRERKLAWSPPESNAGVGWYSDFDKPTDGVEFERGAVVEGFDGP